MGNKRKIVLIDTNNLAYRAFYALPDTISTSTGTLTNAVFGFTSMLLKLMEEHRPDVIIGAFDSRGPTFRHEISKEYKATRKKMPDELSHQMSLIKEVFNSFNIPSMEATGYEADDIIATLVDRSASHFDEVIIVSSDKDILQLVSEKVNVMAIRKGITDICIYDSENVREKFGVEPSLIQDYLALTGDVSDNIPGIPGIGPKTAKELIGEFGSLENIYGNLEKIKSEKLRGLLVENEKSARMSKSLTIIKKNHDLDLKNAIESQLSKKIDFGRVEQIFNTFEFNTLKKRLSGIEGIYRGVRSSGEIKGNGDKTEEAVDRQASRRKIFINDLNPVSYTHLTLPTTPYV
jgi:DNA polymerase-1